MKSKTSCTLILLLCTAVVLYPLVGVAHSAGNCPPLTPPTGQVIEVSNEADLRNTASSAGPSTTIIVSQGVYNLQDYLDVTSNGVTIRGASGNRGEVILDFGGMESGHFGILVDADDVTIADLTIRNASDHGVSIQGRDRPVLYNLHIVDTGDQLVKVNPAGNGSEDGLLACSRLEYTTSAPDSYTNGISAHQAHRWIVRDNEWYRIRGNTDDPVPAILFWSGSSDTVVERNLLVDCSQGIAFGNASHSSVDHTGGIVRNNMIYSSLPHDVVIEMAHAAGWLVAHNTALLLNPTPGLTWGMEARFSDSQGTFAYNLTNMNIWHSRDGAQGTLTGNVTNAQTDWFVDADAADLHLVDCTANYAIDKATALPEVVDDFDGDSRPQGAGYDIGADEATPPRADFTANPIYTMYHQSFVFVDRSAGCITSWLWDFGDHSTSTEQRPVHTYDYPGTYTVTLTVTNPIGLDSKSKSVFVDARRGIVMPWIPLLLLED